MLGCASKPTTDHGPQAVAGNAGNTNRTGSAGQAPAAGDGTRTTAHAGSGSAGKLAPAAGTSAPAAGSGSPAGAGAGAAGTESTPSAGAGGTAGAPSATKKFVGNITTSGQVRSDFALYWDQITPENEGKWGSVEATRNQMNWAGLDRVHDYAKAHGIVFKQHNFVWGSQQPSWLSGLSAADQKAEVEEWIKLFCERYPDVALIDV
jgi:endo-1,4-beta-xylanase